MRRLAAGAAESAERTENLVRDVLARVNLSRDSTAHTVGAVESVLGATKQGHESFALIESAVLENDEWMRAISQASAETHSLIGEMTKRLDAVPRSTESFAASMEEVAASGTLTFSISLLPCGERERASDHVPAAGSYLSTSMPHEIPRGW